MAANNGQIQRFFCKNRLVTAAERRRTAEAEWPALVFKTKFPQRCVYHPASAGALQHAPSRCGANSQSRAQLARHYICYRLPLLVASLADPIGIKSWLNLSTTGGNWR